MGRVGGDDKAAFQLAQQRFLVHDPQHTFVIDRPPVALQGFGHSPITVAGEGQHQPLDRIPQAGRLGLDRAILLLPGVVPGAIDVQQHTELSEG